MLIENKSKTWFKVLTCSGESICKEYIEWSLPKGSKPGKWIETCLPSGTWLVTDPRGFTKDDYRIFKAEFCGNPLIEGVGIVFVERIRLYAEATNLELKQLGIHRAFAQII